MANIGGALDMMLRSFSSNREYLGEYRGKSKAMNKKQKEILIGMILGDCFLQKTGSKNARIRLEHSLKQKDYLLWKASFFPKFFQGKPTLISRFNKRFGKSYNYVRFQSLSSSEIGKFRNHFYDQNGRKIIPSDIRDLLKSPLSLAVWFMDDGYYYQRDKISYIYLPKCLEEEFILLLNSLKNNFDLSPTLKKKSKGYCFIFSVSDSFKLSEIIKPFVISSMKYKLPFDPVSTNPALRD